MRQFNAMPGSRVIYRKIDFMEAPRHIGVFKFKNIGDVILMTPVLQILQDNFPGAKISLAINSDTASLLQGHPCLERVFAYERSFKKRNFIRTLVYEVRFLLRLRRQKFDLTIDFDQGDRSAWYAFLCGAKQRWTYWKPRNWLINRLHFFTQVFEFPPTKMHQVEWHLRLLSEAGLNVPKNTPLAIVVTETDSAWARATKAGWGGGRLVVVHPIARWLLKRWNPRKMAEVIDWLQDEQDCTVVLSNGGSQREIEKVEEILGFCRINPQLLTGGISLGQLAALIQTADCFLGVDTGPMHIAAAVGTPVVSLFGPTSEVNWSPWCEKSVVLKGDCVCRDVETAPCRWDQVRYCMESISTESVKEALAKFLANA